LIKDDKAKSKTLVLKRHFEYYFLQRNRFAFPIFIAFGTGNNFPVITSKIRPYIGTSEGIKG